MLSIKFFSLFASRLIISSNLGLSFFADATRFRDTPSTLYINILLTSIGTNAVTIVSIVSCVFENFPPYNPKPSKEFYAEDKTALSALGLSKSFESSTLKCFLTYPIVVLIISFLLL